MITYIKSICISPTFDSRDNKIPSFETADGCSPFIISYVVKV